MTTPARDFLFARSGASARSVSSDLPEDLKERSVRRVRVFAWIVLAFAAVETAIDHVVAAIIEPSYPSTGELWDLAGIGFVVLISLVAILVSRARSLSIDARVWVGIGFLIALAFVVAATDAADGFWIDDQGRPHHYHGTPAVAIVMLIFPVVVPMTAWRAAAVAAVMSATTPLALVLDAHILGLPLPDAQAFVQSTSFLAIPVAAILAHVIHQLGIDVKRARELGSYTLEEKLGEGGMGEVWRGRHRFLARPAAVKLIRGTGDDSTRLERFEREAQATSQLKSPHTVEVYDFGVSKDGSVFYVMELLEGIDLDRLVAEHGPQPAERVVSWLRQACHSLREAHAAGIVHRDIKPANLFACRYGTDDDFVKVLDFGLAAWGQAFEATDERLTDDGKIVGTPAYLAPEMATGASPSDARSDIYSLGCVAYFALTGRPVFEAPTPLRVILGHIDDPPVPLRDVTDQPIPEALEAAVMKCLAKAPGDRPQSVDELDELLRELPAWTAEQARAWWDER